MNGKTEASPSPQAPAEEPTEPVFRTLYTWRALTRNFKRHDKEFYSTIIAVAILFSIVFFFIKEIFLIIVIWAGVFLVYALSNMPPEEVEHKITTQGITTMNHSYLWDDLGPFWFMESGGEKVLKVSSRGNIFGQMVLLLGNGDEAKIRDTLAKYLPYWEVPEKTFSDKVSEWLVQKFSFERSPKAS